MECAAILNGPHWLILLLTLILLATHLRVADAQSECTPPDNCTSCERLGDIRLVGGEDVTEGRVEFCYNNTWGTVCDNGFGEADATVVCRQLGFSDQGALSFAFAVFGQGTGPIVLDDVVCNGDEQRLIDCGSDGLGQHRCDHFEDVGVRCMMKSIGTVSVSSQISMIFTSSPTFSSIIVELTSMMTSTPMISMSSSQVSFTNRLQITSTRILLSSTTILVVQSSSSSIPASADSPISLRDTSSPPTSTQSPSGRQSSVAVTVPPNVTEGSQSQSSTNPGLIVGLVFLFIVLIVLTAIFVLLLIICLRKRNEKDVKKNTRLWYIQANPIAQTSSFEGDSIFNLLEQNAQIRYGTGHRNPSPVDFLVVRHRLPKSTIPNPYNTTPTLETKSVSINQADTQSSGENHDSGMAEPSTSPANNIPSGVKIDSNERVIYAVPVVTFKGSKASTEQSSADHVSEKPGSWEELDECDYDSEWSKGSWDEVTEEEDEETMKESLDKSSEKHDLTYSEVQFEFNS